MGSSAKKKKEKKQDFQKAKLKVGKARPKNTNATSTSFSAKSIVFKQQNLSEAGSRDTASLFNHNLSLLSSRNDSQRRDALIWLTTAVAAATPSGGAALPQPASVILSKAQPLILDGSAQVRAQLLRLVKALPGEAHIGSPSIEQAVLYTRAGLTHLSHEIRKTSLDVLDWLLEMHGPAVVSCAGGWVKTVQTFQNLLSWQATNPPNPTSPAATDGKWSSAKTTTTSTNLGSNKLLVHQLITLSHLLVAGLQRAPPDPHISARRAAALFPLWDTHAHLLPEKSKPFGALNLFGAPREIESEIYADAEERETVFLELGFLSAFEAGVREAKTEGGDVGRAAARVDKALGLVKGGI